MSKTTEALVAEVKKLKKDIAELKEETRRIRRFANVPPAGGHFGPY